jgi:hypothetical protein
MNQQMRTEVLHSNAQQWVDALTCQDVVLRFMGLFDARAWALMETLVTRDIEWQRPDQTIVGLTHLRETLCATPDSVRVRHIITNLRPTFTHTGILIHSYFTVFRAIGVTADSNGPVASDGPVSSGRYRDELVKVDGAWRISSKHTQVDFRRT